jgi:hypothetical protein
MFKITCKTTNLPVVLKNKKLLKVSHDEEAFKKTEPLQLISYEFSKKLKI